MFMASPPASARRFGLSIGDAALASLTWVYLRAAAPAAPQPDVAKRMESAWSLLPLWGAVGGPKAPAIWPHSRRFARFAWRHFRVAVESVAQGYVVICGNPS